MYKVISIRLLAIAVWVAFSIGSISWWKKIAVLSPEDNPIWWPSETASFLPGSWAFFALMAAVLTMLYILELINKKPAKLKSILFWVFILGLGAIFVYPLGTKDIFNYVSFARLHAYYGLNPHLFTVSDVNNYIFDPFLKNMYHIKVVSPYGPLWTWLSYGLYNLVASFGLIPFIISFKMLGLLTHLLITVMVYKIAEFLAEGNGPRAAIIYGMNPLAIFELVANAHNDGPAIIFLLIALFFILQKRTLNGLIALGAAVSFKFTAMLTSPFFIWRAVRDRNLVYAVLGTSIFALIIIIFYLTTKVSTFEIAKTSVGGFLNFSFSSLFLFIAGDKAVPYARATGMIIFVLWYYVILRRFCNENPDTLNITIGLGIIAYLLFGAYMVHRWYYLWPLALTVVTPNHPWAKTVVIQTIILLPCYTLTLFFGEVDIDKSITYTLSLIPVLITGLMQYRRRLLIK